MLTKEHSILLEMYGILELGISPGAVASEME
jgi:hypothetical protein